MSKRVFVLTELINITYYILNIAVNNFDTKEPARFSQVLVVTELVISGAQSISEKKFCFSV